LLLYIKFVSFFVYRQVINL